MLAFSGCTLSVMQLTSSEPCFMSEKLTAKLENFAYNANYRIGLALEVLMMPVFLCVMQASTRACICMSIMTSLAMTTGRCCHNLPTTPTTDRHRLGTSLGAEAECSVQAVVLADPEVTRTPVSGEQEVAMISTF